MWWRVASVLHYTAEVWRAAEAQSKRWPTRRYCGIKQVTHSKHLTDTAPYFFVLVFVFLLFFFKRVHPNTLSRVNKSLAESLYVESHFDIRTEAGGRKTKVIKLCMTRTHYSECGQQSYSTIYVVRVSTFCFTTLCGHTYVHTLEWLACGSLHWLWWLKGPR